MAEDEERGRLRGGGEGDARDEGGDVGEHERGGPREAAVDGLADRAAPAALVEGVGGDAGCREGREEVVVAADVVAEAVDEDELGDGGGGLVGLEGRVLVRRAFGWLNGKPYEPGLLVETGVPDLELPFNFLDHFQISLGECL